MVHKYHDWDISTDDDIDILELWQSSIPTSSSVYPSSESDTTNISTSESSNVSTISPASNSSVVKPPFTTPPKLKPIEQVLADNPGNSVANLRNLALSLARDAIFGKDEMSKLSLSGRKNTSCFDEKKMEYIKTVVRSKVPNMSEGEFNGIWALCKGTISKSSQTLRTKAKRKLITM